MGAGVGKRQGILFDAGELSDWGGYLLGSLRRRVLVALVAGLATLALGASFALSRSEEHLAEARLSSVSADPSYTAEGVPAADPLALATVDRVTSHEQLVDLTRTLSLDVSWTAGRRGLFRLTDELRAKLSAGGPTDQNTARILAKRIEAKVEGTSVSFAVRWPDPAVATQIVARLQQDFLAARQDAELGPAKQRLAAMEANVLAAQGRVDDGAVQVQSASDKKRQGAKAATVRGVQAEGRFRDMPDAALVALRQQILDVRRSIEEREAQRRSRLTQLQALAVEQRASFGPRHPSLLDTLDRISSSEGGEREVARLRKEETALVSRFVAAGGREAELSLDVKNVWPVELDEKNEELLLARAGLSASLEELGRARNELSEASTSAAALEGGLSRRVAVVQAAAPSAEKAGAGLLVLLAGALLASLVAALAASIAAELLGNRVVESWQVERLLGVPVLATVKDGAIRG